VGVWHFESWGIDIYSNGKFGERVSDQSLRELIILEEICCHSSPN